VAFNRAWPITSNKDDHKYKERHPLKKRIDSSPHSNYNSVIIIIISLLLGSPEKEEEEELELPFRWRAPLSTEMARGVYKNSMGLVKKETLISFSFIII
jgi:hypothetical protein